MSGIKLKERIVNRSVSDLWEIARHEWTLDRIYISKSKEVCLCGHSPIKEICLIKNLHNGNKVVVGNSCVMKFFNIDSEKVFNYLRKISNGKTVKINSDVLSYSKDQEIVSEWEFDFFTKVSKLTKPSEKQREILVKIERKIGNFFSNNF